jgi:hypothetical protein
MAILSGITVLNAPLKCKMNEEAGDKYNTAANNLFVEVFCSDYSPEARDLKTIIDKYVLHFDELSDRYVEPSPGAINKIMGGEDYEFLIQLRELA